LQLIRFVDNAPSQDIGAFWFVWMSPKKECRPLSDYTKITSTYEKNIPAMGPWTI